MGEARNSAISPRAAGSHFQMHLETWVCLWGKLEKESEEHELLAREQDTFCGGQKHWGRVGLTLVWPTSNTPGFTTDPGNTRIQPSHLTPNTSTPQRGYLICPSVMADAWQHQDWNEFSRAILSGLKRHQRLPFSPRVKAEVLRVDPKAPT